MAKAKGPTDYPLHDLPADRFEQLGFLLARTENPSVVPVRNKDAGLDARLPDDRGATSRGWQAKRFTKEIHWAQCRDSVQTALAFWRPPRITFVFVNDLSAKDQRAFEDDLASRFPLVRLDFWSGSEVQRRIRDTAEGRRAVAWLFNDDKADKEAMLRAIATGSALSSTQQTAERQAVIQAYMDRDPHLQYTIVSRSPGAPETPPSSAAVLSLTIEVDDQEVRFDASERYPGALQDLGGPPRLVLSDDDAGATAAAALEDIAAHGGSRVITSGATAGMPTVPIGLRGLLPDDGLRGVIEVSAATEDAAADLTPLMPVLVCAGEVELALFFDLLNTPKTGYDSTLAGSTGGLELAQSVRGLGIIGPTRWTLDWRHRLGQGTAVEQLLAATIVLAAISDEPIELRHPADHGFLATIQGADGDVGDEDYLRSWIAFLELVAELERWLGQPLYPTADPTPADSAELGRALGLVRRSGQPGSWDRMSVELVTPPELPQSPLELVALSPQYVSIFGSHHYLGMEMTAFHRATATVKGARIVCTPDGDRSLTVTLHRPDEVPPEAAVGAADGGARILARSVA